MEINENNEKINVLDLFAGCGGFSKGFELSGKFDIVAANEIWKPAQETYVRNHANTRLVRGDITEDSTKRALLDAFKDRVCDVIIGGPPCQAYSNAGFRDPEDPRGRLFEEYVHLVDALRPKMFVMENVKGILTMYHERADLLESEAVELEELRRLELQRHELLLLRKRHRNNPERFPFTETDVNTLDAVKNAISQKKRTVHRTRERVVDIICRRFREIGYKVEYKLLNAADYGVPQKRERVIFIGVQDRNKRIEFPQPTHFECSGPSLFEFKKWRTVRESIDDLKDAPESVDFSHIYTRHSDEFLEKIRNTPLGCSVFGGYSDSFYRNPPDEPSRTVKENHGGVLVHYDRERVMTPRELARLQSFPDDFKFLGSKSQILVQIGNAVPPLLGKAIAECLSDMLRTDREQSPRTIAKIESCQTTQAIVMAILNNQTATT